ncbi:MAG TPA: hypothetical protein VM597_32755 [Gemmataceae bacterium]|jgi:hypothetical protein|nr:hypothetical protein [Gemmataceae bacterium]
MRLVVSLSPNALDQVRRAYHRAEGTWTGCDWPTSFGDTGLDLNGITAHQALLMSRATAGVEAADWREAVQWLRLVEADAEAAETAGRQAAEDAARGDLVAARRAAGAACELEARYHARPVWGPLHQALESLSAREFSGGVSA